jgi:glyoxylase I family protein
VSADEAGPAGGTSSTGGANLDHVCLRVEPFDAAEIARHLAGQNVTCGAETLRYGAEGEGPSIYLRDPEGNGIELKGAATQR